MSQVSIMIVDDEARMRKLVSDFLKKEGYRVLEAEDGKAALDLFYSHHKIDLIILDVMMPRMDGWAVCRQIRESSKIPVIMLTAKNEEADELFGFGLGADEFISKPFSLQVLAARVKALLRRSAGGRKPLKEFDGLKIDEAGHVVYIDGLNVDLSPKEFELLSYLTDNEGIALSREQILNAVWEYDYFGDCRTVDTHVKKLRLKLGYKGEYIQTVRGLGYKFEVANEVLY